MSGVLSFRPAFSARGCCRFQPAFTRPLRRTLEERKIDIALAVATEGAGEGTVSKLIISHPWAPNWFKRAPGTKEHGYFGELPPWPPSSPRRIISGIAPITWRPGRSARYGC
jgi:hypothetical protein